jgi:hypothetical protein
LTGASRPFVPGLRPAGFIRLREGGNMALNSFAQQDTVNPEAVARLLNDDNLVAVGAEGRHLPDYD